MARRLSIDRLCVSIGRAQVLRDVTVQPSETGWFGLLGANGSGKTTLLRALSGRLNPSAGRIWLDGVDVTASPATRARVIGYAPAIHTLPSSVTVSELLTLVGRARTADPKQPASLWEALEIDVLGDRIIGSMSSGMRQRLALHLAFVGSPRVVLLDEPFNWLDPVAAFDAKICLEEQARSLLIITALHDIATFALRCSEGSLLRDGELVRRFGPAEMLSARQDLGRFERDIYNRLKSGFSAGARSGGGGD